MNYLQDKVILRSLDGVKSEWLIGKESPVEADGQIFMTPSKFLVEYIASMKVVLTVAKFSKKEFTPAPEKVLEVLRMLTPSEVKVIFLGQDPYPKLGDAEGIAFHSMAERCPYSARKINQALIKHNKIPAHLESCSDYRPWVKQGVLLINTALTTEIDKPAAHSVIWRNTTQALLRMLPKDATAILLGNDAQSFQASIMSKKKIMGPHPVMSDFGKVDIFADVPINWTPGV